MPLKDEKYRMKIYFGGLQACCKTKQTFSSLSNCHHAFSYRCLHALVSPASETMITGQV